MNLNVGDGVGVSDGEGVGTGEGPGVGLIATSDQLDAGHSPHGPDHAPHRPIPKPPVKNSRRT